MKKIRIILGLLSMILLSISCKKGYLDINDNPNSPTSSSITPALILPRAQHAVAARVGAGYGTIARWMGYWARSGTYGPSTEEESYNITNGFLAGEWTGWYDVLFDIHTMEQKAKASGLGYYEGIAKVLKSFGFMYLVDMYNNVPYSKAFDLGNNIQPAYDNGQDVYNGLLRELDEALVLIDAAPLANYQPEITTADLMCAGSKSKWKKIINTQRLKLILRQSQVPGFNPAAQVAKITSDGYLGAGETVSVNPGYVVDLNKQNPFWNTYKAQYTGALADDYNRANNYVLNILRNSNDIRYQYYFSPAVTPTNGTYFGYDYGSVAAAPFAVNSSAVSGPGLAKSASQSQWLLTSIESMFLQAEAIQRTWIPGNAQAMFENAIRESHNWLGVANANTVANAYISSGNSLSDFAASTNKISTIITQKYLSLCGINNFEAWADYRRLGVPNIPLSLSPSRGANVIPVRLRYPQSEYNLNAANAEAQGNPNPQSSGVFWDR